MLSIDEANATDLRRRLDDSETRAWELSQQKVIDEVYWESQIADFKKSTTENHGAFSYALVYKLFKTWDYGVFANKCTDTWMGLYLTIKMEKIFEKRPDLPQKDLPFGYDPVAKAHADEDFMMVVYEAPDFALLQHIAHSSEPL